MKEVEIIDVPERDHIVTSLEVTTGAPIPALDYLKVFNADSWADLTLELVSYWKSQYSRVLRCGTGGDMDGMLLLTGMTSLKLGEIISVSHMKRGLVYP